jgi:hypothetical protein
MSSHVGPIVVGGHQLEEEQVSEEHGGQQMSCATETNFSLEQGKPQYM